MSAADRLEKLADDAAQAETKRLQALHLNCTKRCHKALTDLAAAQSEVERLRAALREIEQLRAELTAAQSELAFISEKLDLKKEYVDSLEAELAAVRALGIGN